MHAYFFLWKPFYPRFGGRMDLIHNPVIYVYGHLVVMLVHVSESRLCLDQFLEPNKQWQAAYVTVYTVRKSQRYDVSRTKYVCKGMNCSDRFFVVFTLQWNSWKENIIWRNNGEVTSYGSAFRIEIIEFIGWKLGMGFNHVATSGLLDVIKMNFIQGQ